MIHLVFSNLNAWLLGTHHGVSAQHLPAYLTTSSSSDSIGASIR